MDLWSRIKRGMEEGFDAALSSVHTITAKAGEGIELTRLRREKARCETRITRLLAEMGNKVYEKISSDRLDDLANQLGIQDRLKEVAENEAAMVEIDRKLKKELGAPEE
jgi:hypothetical protein